MRQFFITILGTIVGIFVFFIGIFILFAVIGMASAPKAPTKSVLNLDLRYSVQDHSSGNSLFGSAPLSVVDTVKALNAAKTDDKVKGLFIRANGFGMVPASAEEIRLAIKDFKSSGKFVVTHSQGFEGTTFTNYMAVSASDEIWQQDTTGFAVAGIRSESEFFGGVFEKIEAEPQIEKFHEYKNAGNVYTETGYTDAHREATTSLLQSIFDSGLTRIAEDRGMSVDDVKAKFSAAPHSAESALEAGFIDKLGHYQAAKDYVKSKAGGDDVAFVSVRNYTPSFVAGPTIAFIGGQGPVVAGSSSDGSSPFSNSITMGGDTIADAFHSATKDKSVKAIVFRVSTPGGSPTASDQIHDAVARAQEAGKPVIISMGQYAASGGYYVSANADKIVAMPTTITGSIGVVGGKVALQDSFAKLGYTIDDINLGGEYVSAYSADEPFTETQRAAYRGQLQDIYDDFTSRVAEGRNLPLERVQEIAKGRVWTGEQGLELGLVDEVGGLMKAIEVAKELGGIDADKKPRIKVFPRPKTTAEQIEELLGESAQVRNDLAFMREIGQLPEVQAIISARSKIEPGQELMADLPVIK